MHKFPDSGSVPVFHVQKNWFFVVLRPDSGSAHGRIATDELLIAAGAGTASLTSPHSLAPLQDSRNGTCPKHVRG